MANPPLTFDRDIHLLMPTLMAFLVPSLMREPPALGSTEAVWTRMLWGGILILAESMLYCSVASGHRKTPMDKSGRSRGSTSPKAASSNTTVWDANFLIYCTDLISGGSMIAVGWTKCFSQLLYPSWNCTMIPGY